MFRKD